jgi:hypothetical protein
VLASLGVSLAESWSGSGGENLRFGEECGRWLGEGAVAGKYSDWSLGALQRAIVELS